MHIFCSNVCEKKKGINQDTIVFRPTNIFYRINLNNLSTKYHSYPKVRDNIGIFLVNWHLKKVFFL